MFGNLSGWHLVIILAIVLLLFGAPKLPGLARSLGQSMRIFRSEVKTMKNENGEDVPVDEQGDEAPPAAKPAAGKAARNSTKPKP